jgi:lysozyme
MKVSIAGLDLIKKHEGLRLNAYRCPAGVWTIGYGITSSAGVGKVTPGMKITQAEAEDMLRRALAVFEAGVEKAIKRQPTQAQFDAMVSLAYNIGVGAFSKSSVVRHFNAGDMDRAAISFLMWNKAAGKVLPGLTKRRADERAWFLRASPMAHDEPMPPAVTPAPPPAGPEPVAVEPAKEPAKEAPLAPGKSIAGWLLAAGAALFAALAAWMTQG